VLIGSPTNDAAVDLQPTTVLPTHGNLQPTSARKLTSVLLADCITKDTLLFGQVAAHRIAPVVASLERRIDRTISAKARESLGLVAGGVADAATLEAIGASLSDGVAVIASLERWIDLPISAEARESLGLVAGGIADGATLEAIGASLCDCVAVIAGLDRGVGLAIPAGGVREARCLRARGAANGAILEAVGAGFRDGVAVVAVF
jgi:hypothetical protein